MYRRNSFNEVRDVHGDFLDPFLGIEIEKYKVTKIRKVVKKGQRKWPRTREHSHELHNYFSSIILRIFLFIFIYDKVMIFYLYELHN